MKKLVLLTIILSLLLCGCGAQEEAIQITEPVIQTEAPTEAPTEATIEITIMETEAVELGMRVEDCYSEEFDHPSGEGKYCVHIPQFVINGNRDLLINNKINSEHMSKIYEDSQDGQPTYSAAYAVGQTEAFASVITCFGKQEYDFAEYSIFHINVDNGKEVTDTQILSAFGYTPDSFQNAVRKAMEKQFYNENASMRDSVGRETYEKTLTEHLSKENITSARPFIDEAGQLCIMVKCYTFAGAGYYYNRISLENPARYPAPQVIACSEHP